MLCFNDSFSEKSLLKKAKELYKSAFPPAERIPFWMLKRACKKGRAEFLSITEDNKFVGIAYCVLMENRVSLFYFAVSENMRNGGYGTEILDMLKERYSGKRIYLEAEKPDEHAENNAERLRRIGFYARNGFEHCGYDVTEFGVTYDILSFGGRVTLREYKDLMRYFAGDIIYFLRFKKMLGD